MSYAQGCHHGVAWRTGCAACDAEYAADTERFLEQAERLIRDGRPEGAVADAGDAA